MKKLLLLAACVFFVASGFGFKAELNLVGDKKYKAVELTPAIYQNSKQNLGDLRICDEDGNEVPYFIYGADNHGYNAAAEYELERTAAFVDKNDFITDLKIKEIKENADMLISGLTLQIPGTDYAKRVIIYGSHDGLNWTHLAEGTLYKVESVGNDQIGFYDNVKFTHYRIRIINNAEEIRINGGKAYLNALEEKERLIRTLKAEYITEQREMETSIYIPDAKNLKLKSVTLETETIFERYITADKPYLLYNLAFSGVSLKNTSVELNGKQFDELTLTINNGNDKPLAIDGIELAYYADRLVFAAEQGKKYYLYFNRDDYNTPQYDITNYKDYILDEGFDECGVLNIEHMREESPQPKDYAWIFNVVVIITGILIAVYILTQVLAKKTV